MLFHLARFSVFLFVIMAGFALTFYSLFFECVRGDLGESFEDFPSSLLTMFDAMLGGANFSMFDEEASDCKGPSWAHDAGVLLLVLFMIVMAILLLNLLIAVLSTIHDEVSVFVSQSMSRLDGVRGGQRGARTRGVNNVSVGHLAGGCKG